MDGKLATDNRVNVQNMLKKFENTCNHQVKVTKPYSPRCSPLSSPTDTNKNVIGGPVSNGSNSAATSVLVPERPSLNVNTWSIRRRQQQLKQISTKDPLKTQTTVKREPHLNDKKVREIASLFQATPNALKSNGNAKLPTTPNKSIIIKDAVTPTDCTTKPESNNNQCKKEASENQEDLYADNLEIAPCGAKAENVGGADDVLRKHSGSTPKPNLPTGPPPQKPVRTFAHDVYMNGKMVKNKVKVDQATRGPTADKSQKVTRSQSDSPSPSKPNLPPKPVRSKTVPSITSPNPNRKWPSPRRNKGRPHTPPPPRPSTSVACLPQPYAVTSAAVQEPDESRPPKTDSRTAVVVQRSLRQCQPSMAVSRMRHHYGILKRCHSEEHIYDEPWNDTIRGLCVSRTAITPGYLDRRKSPSLVLPTDPHLDIVFVENDLYRSSVEDKSQQLAVKPLRKSSPKRNPVTKATTSCTTQPSKELHYMSSVIVPMGNWPPSTLPASPRHYKVPPSAGNSSISPQATTIKRPDTIDLDGKRQRTCSVVFNSSTGRRASQLAAIMNYAASSRDDSGDSDSEVSEKEVQKRIAYIHKISRGPSLRRQDLPVPLQHYRQHFDAVLTVGLKYIDGTTTYEPYVKDIFPFPECLKTDPKVLAHFCFPDAEAWRPTSQRETYTFVLTNEKGERLFGYCRRVKPEGVEYNIPVVYCIISPILARAYYSQVLGEMEKQHGLPGDYVKAFLQTLQSRSVPRPGMSLTIKCSDLDGEQQVTFSRSSDHLVENSDTPRLLSQLRTGVLLKVFASLLLERRVLFCASQPEMLTECIHAFMSLLYPFAWQHTLIPILPTKMIDVILSPTPYVIGILSSETHKLEDMELEEGIMVDLDTSRLIREAGDEMTIIPKKIQRNLATNLKTIKGTSDELPKSTLISEVFLQLFTDLVGHYQDQLSIYPDKQKIFHREAFCTAPESRSVQMFLKWFTETQMFETFVENRTSRWPQTGLFEQYIKMSQVNGDVLKPARLKDFSKKMKNIGGKLIGLKSPVKG